MLPFWGLLFLIGLQQYVLYLPLEEWIAIYLNINSVCGAKHLSSQNLFHLRAGIFTPKQETWLCKHVGLKFCHQLLQPPVHRQGSDLHGKTVMQEVSAAKEESTSSNIYVHF